MKNLIKTTVALIVMGLGTLNAEEHHNHSHTGHDHNHAHKHGPHKKGDSKVAVQIKANEASIEKNAKQEIKKLVLKKKIPASWTDVVMQKMEKTKNKTNDWKVSFNNPKIVNKAKQTLYVFVSAYGKVVAVNYTGK